MVKKRAHTSRSTEPPGSDDLRLIDGIGPAVEHRLQGVGVNTFDQLAALSPADIAAAVADLTGLTTERIIKQDWIGQARKLAAGSISKQTHVDGEIPAEAHISISQDAEPPPQVLQEVEPIASTLEEAASPALIEAESTILFGTAPISEQAEIGSPVMTKASHQTVLRLRQMEVVAAHPLGSQNFLQHDEPFSVHLALDLSKVPEDVPLMMKASIYGKNLEGYSRQILGEASEVVTSPDRVTVTIAGRTPPTGIYRLEVEATLQPMATEGTQNPGSSTAVAGGLLIVF